MSSAGRRYEVLGPALIMTSGRLLAFAAAFFIPVVLARVLTVAEFGTYKQIFLVYATLYCVAQVGISNSLYYFAPRAPHDTARFAANAVWTLAATGALCIVLLVSQQDLLGWLLGNASLAEHAPAIGVYLLLMLVASPFEVILVSRRRYAAASAVYAASDLVRAALLVLPALWMRDLRGLMLGAVAAGALRAVAMLACLRREFGAELRPQWTLYRQQLAYSIPFALAVVVEIAQLQYHQFYVAHNFDAATFAIYAVGCLQIPLLEFVATPICDVMMVRMAERQREGAGPAAAHAVWRDAARSLALFCFPLFALLALAAPDIIVLLFTARYAASVPIFVLWSAGMLLTPLLVDGVLRVHAETRFILAMNLAQLALVVALIGPLVGRWGLVGAVAATLAATALAKTAGVARIALRQRLALAELLPWRDLGALAAAAAVAAVPALAARAWLDDPLPRAAAAAAAYLPVYWLLARWWGDVPSIGAPLRRRLRSLLPTPPHSEVPLG